MKKLFYKIIENRYLINYYFYKLLRNYNKLRNYEESIY